MFLAFCCLVILVGTALAGGDLVALTYLRLRRSSLLFLALAVQVAITTFPHAAAPALLDALHVATYGLAAAFVWLNRRVPGLLLLAAGAAANLTAITANGGELPASRSALIEAGQPLGSGFANSGVLAHPHLAWLGDVVATPGWLPFRNVISLGDVVILLGAGWLVAAVCGLPRLTRLTRRPGGQSGLAADPVELGQVLGG